jgi:hypothetical protein
MSDLGALSQINQSATQKIIQRAISFWIPNYVTPIDIVNVDVSAALSGNVKVGGVNQANSKVFIYHRRTGNKIASLVTDASGNFSFTGLNGDDVANYFAVAITDDAGDYNALIFDKLTAG